MVEVLPDKVLDAGESGCGHLVMMAYQAMKSLKPGETLEVLSNDEAADLDLTAWCYMTGHSLLACHSGNNPKRILVSKRA
jgi:tRNA 2-thiouridine synthesizing protein A